MTFTQVAVAVFVGLVVPANAFNNNNIQKPMIESSYLDQFSRGGAATVKPSSYAPSKGKPQGTGGGVPGSYLSQMSSGGTTPSYSAPSPSYSAPAPARAANDYQGMSAYDQQMAAAMAAAKANAQPATPAAPAAPAANGASAPAADTRSYLSNMGGGASNGGWGGAKKSYAPTQSNVSKKSGGSGIGSYLDNVGNAGPMQTNNYASAVAQPAAPFNGVPAPSNGAAAPNTASYLSNMGGHGSPYSRQSSYAPSGGGKPQGTRGGVPGSYLGQL